MKAIFVFTCFTVFVFVNAQPQIEPSSSVDLRLGGRPTIEDLPVNVDNAKSPKRDIFILRDENTAGANEPSITKPL